MGNLKKKVENAKTKEEAKDAIKKAGMLLDDDELEQVSGGGGNPLEDLLNPGFQEGDKVRYLGNNGIYYGKYGTISKINDIRFKALRDDKWYRVQFEWRSIRLYSIRPPKSVAVFPLSPRHTARCSL